MPYISAALSFLMPNIRFKNSKLSPNWRNVGEVKHADDLIVAVRDKTQQINTMDVTYEFCPLAGSTITYIKLIVFFLELEEKHWKNYSA